MGQGSNNQTVDLYQERDQDSDLQGMRGDNGKENIEEPSEPYRDGGA